MLSKQNDAIRGMMDRNKHITSSKEPLVTNSDMSSTIGGTPKPIRRVQNRGNSQSRLIEKEMNLPKGNPIITMKGSMGFGSAVPPQNKGKASSNQPKQQVARGRSSNVAKSTPGPGPLQETRQPSQSSSAGSSIHEGAAAKFDPKNWMLGGSPKKGKEIPETEEEFKENFLTDYLHKAEGQIKLQ